MGILYFMLGGLFGYLMASFMVAAHDIEDDTNKLVCAHCRHELIWSADFSFEDYGIEKEGIISTYTCPQCGAYAEFYTTMHD